MPTAFLAVFSEPGTKVSLEEFQNWYDDEHVPLRMNHLRSFLTGARFHAIDSKKPSWAALYDIDDTATFQHESYTRLRVNRSPREADLISRLELLDRRTCELVFDSGESSLSTSLAARDPTEVVVTHGFTRTRDWDLQSWQETLLILSGVNGWIRTRLFKYLDVVKTGTETGPEKELEQKVLVVHELQDPSVVIHDEFRRIVNTSDIVELRIWQLYRAYPGIVQGNTMK